MSEHVTQLRQTVPVAILAVLAALAAPIFGPALADAFGDILFLPTILFWIAVTVGCVWERTRLIALPVLILATPGLVDNAFPSVWIGPLEEANGAPIPIITSLDIGLLAAALASLVGGSRLRNLRVLAFLAALFAIALLSYGVNAAASPRFDAAVGLVDTVNWGRALLLVVALSPAVTEPAQMRRLLLGLGAALLVLLVDSAVFTLVRRSGTRLTAGSLGRNTFGNLLAGMTLVFLAGGLAERTGRRRYSRLFFAAAALAALMVLLTQTRMSALALIVTIPLFVWLLPGRGRIRRMVGLTAGLAMLGGAAVALDLYLGIGYMDRFGALVAVVQGGVGNADTETVTPVYTRLVLWTLTVKMIGDHPWFGVGPTHWNWAKYDYGSPFRLLLDAHNGYLHLVATFGFPFLLVLLMVAFRTLKKGWDTLRSRLGREPAVRYHAIYLLGFTGALFVLLLTELSNAGLAKNKIILWFALVLVVISDLVREIRRRGRAEALPSP